MRLPVSLAGMMVWSAIATAQVTTNEGAIDQLSKPAAPAPRRAAPPPSRPRPAPARPAAPAPQAAKPPAIPVIPPAILALPPPVAVPLAHPPPDPVAAITDDAPGDAMRLDHGVRITFGTDRTDLNPATAAALRAFAREFGGEGRISISILAYAVGSPDDPSTPRRLSLERALTARAVLMQSGIASPRIYPRALGPTGGDVDPDRVDVVTGTPPSPAADPARGRAG